DYAYLGVETTPLWPQLAEQLNLDVDSGALVADIVSGGPADKAGLCCREDPDRQLRFQGITVNVGGDVIVGVNGRKVVEESALPRLVSRLDPGDEITLEVIRDGRRREITVELGERPLRTQSQG